MPQSILWRFKDKTTNSWNFFRLGGDLKSRFLLAFIVFLPFLRKKLAYFNKRKLWSASLKYRGKIFPLTLAGSHEEVLMIKEIFLEESYKFHPGDYLIRTIFDLGANIGLASIYFAIQYPNAAIYAFEPDPQNFSLLKKNTSDFKNIRIFPLAVGAADGSADFYSFPDRGISSSLKARAGGEKIRVETKKLDTLLAEFHISTLDLLKYDIEGAEYEVLRAFTGIKRVRYMLGEVHTDLIGVPAEEFLNLLRDNGFDYESKGMGKSNRFSVVATHNE